VISTSSSLQNNPVLIRCFAALLWLSAASPLSAAQLAIIIDDVGYNQTQGQKLVALDLPVTLAVLPFTPHGKTLAAAGQRAGKDIMLHAPMASSQDISAGRRALTSGMTRSELRAALDTMLADVPGAIGVNNHMGSQLTRERESMGWVMEALAERQLFFIDSRTTAETVALEMAQAQAIPTMKRDVFLDNQRTQPAIRKQLKTAIALAERQGYAIAIGHPYPETVAVLQDADSLLANTPVRVVPVSTLLSRHSKAPLVVKKPLSRSRQCPAPPLLLWRPLDIAAASHSQHDDQPVHPLLDSMLFFEPLSQK